MQLYLESFKTFNKLVDLSMTVSQLSSVSAQTIAYRTMFMQHGAATTKWQEKEAKAMTQEKVDAAQEGSQVLWKGWLEMNQSILATYQKSISRANEVGMPAAPIDLISTQAQMMKVTEECALDSIKLSNEILDTLQKSIHPAYGYASGNADRLSNKK